MQGGETSLAPTVLYFFTFHTYRGKFDWQNLVFMNMHEAVKTNLLPMKSHVTIKYSSISMTSYRDFLTKNRKCSEVRLGQGPWPVAGLAQLLEQRTSVRRVVGSSPTPGTNTFLLNVTLLVSEVVLIIFLKHQPETPQTC